jgi:hypothetical protein
MSETSSQAPTHSARGAWRAWRRVARKAGDLQLRVILFVIYYLSVVPLALLARRTLKQTVGASGAAWVPVEAHDDAIDALGRQH